MLNRPAYIPSEQLETDIHKTGYFRNFGKDPYATPENTGAIMTKVNPNDPNIYRDLLTIEEYRELYQRETFIIKKSISKTMKNKVIRPTKITVSFTNKNPVLLIPRKRVLLIRLCRVKMIYVLVLKASRVIDYCYLLKIRLQLKKSQSKIAQS